MHNVYLFQPQYTTVINGKVNNWIPYSAGTIWSFALQFSDIRENFVLKDLIYAREKAEFILDRMIDPVVCGFSCYLWNRNYCLKLAEQIKQRWPECVIVFGGPEVSQRMSEHKFIDVLILGEGEENFVDVLRNILSGTDPSLFLPKKRLPELDIPSPYLTGIFDKIMSDAPEVMWAMTLETNRGCPYQCTFCDWGSLTYAKVKKFGLEKVFAEISWIKDHAISYVYVADANFGMFKERDLLIANELRAATDGSSVDLISVQSAKQSTEIAFEIGKALGDKYAGVSIAMQSMNAQTLVDIKRKNLATNNIRNLLDLSVKYQVPTYTEMILGMPSETKDPGVRVCLNY
jgi:putative methyltransferase